MIHSPINVTIPNISIPNIDTSFEDNLFSFIFLSELNNEFSNNINLLNSIDTFLKELKYNFYKISMEYARKIENLLNSYSKSSNKAMLGSFEYEITSLQEEEYVKKQELYLNLLKTNYDNIKYVLDTYITNQTEFINLYFKDVKLSIQNREKILNDLIEFRKVFIEYISNINELYRIHYENNKFKYQNFLKEFETAVFELQNLNLDNDTIQALNDYKTAYAEYLNILHNKNDLEYELNKTKLMKYEADLKKYDAMIDRINIMTNIVNINQRLYSLELENAETILSNNRELLEIKDKYLSLNKELLSMKDDELSIKYQEQRNKLEVFENKLKVKEAELQKLKSIILEKIYSLESDVVNKEREYTINKVNYLKSILDLEKMKTIMDADYRIFEKTHSSIIDDAVRYNTAYAEALRYYVSGASQFKRTETLTSAKVVSTIINRY